MSIVARSMILVLAALSMTSGVNAMSIDRPSESDLSSSRLSADSCRCISIVPTGGTTSGRSSFQVSNSCGGLGVSVGFAGDIARMSPKLVIPAWANAGILKGDSLRQITTPEGWTVASIAAYRLRNKSGAFVCRLDAAVASQELDRKRRLTFNFTTSNDIPIDVRLYSKKEIWSGRAKVKAGL